MSDLSLEALERLPILIRWAFGVFLLCLPLVGQDAKEHKDRFLAHLEATVERTQKLRDCLPREEFDLDALAKGKDGAALLAWVDRHIAFEPYRGIMKGARGTLMSRGGNSADKALLLATLLSKIGVTAKLVSGTLGEDKRPKPGLPVLSAPAGTPEALIARCAAQSEIPESILKKLYQADQAQKSRFVQRLWSRVDRDLRVVRDALGKIEPPAAIEADVPDEHWWVRTEQGDIGPAGEENAVYELDNLPDESFHKLTVRMKIRKDEEEITTLDVTYRTADLYGETLVVGHSPIDSLPKLFGVKKPTRDQILQTLASTTQFQPQVSTASKVVAGHPFDLSGNKLKVSSGRIEAAQGMGQGLGGLFGGGGDKQESKTKLTGCWLEIELGDVKIRRTLFEKGASDRQRVFDLLATREILVGTVSESFVADQSLRHVVALKDFIAAQAKALGSGLILENYRKRPYTNETLYAFAIGRQNEMRRLRDARFKDIVYFQPRSTLVSYIRRFVDPSKVQSGIDILHNDLTPIGQKGGWDQNFALAAGVLDTALEHEVNRAPGDHANASVLFERALLDGQTPKAVKTDDDLRVSIPGAYYRIDASTGMSLGHVGEGGQDLAEYSENVAVVLQLRQALLFYADFFRCIALGVTVPLSGNEMDVAACVWDLVCSAALDVATSPVDVATNWTNIIIQNTIASLWGGVSEAGTEGICQKLRKQLGIGQ